jgi:hypothetical protein
MDNLSEVDILECNEETARNVKKLKAMGFVDISEALKIAQNDINKAVSILTSDRLPRSIEVVTGCAKKTTESNTGSNKRKHNYSYKNEITINSNKQDTAMQNKNNIESVGTIF